MTYLPESEESDWDLKMLLRMKLKQFLYRNGMNMRRKHTEIIFLMILNGLQQVKTMAIMQKYIKRVKIIILGLIFRLGIDNVLFGH